MSLTGAQSALKVVDSGRMWEGTPASRLTTNTLSEAPMAARNSTPPTQSAILREWRTAMRDCGASEEEIRRVEMGDLNKPWKKESTNEPRNAQQS